MNLHEMLGIHLAQDPVKSYSELLGIAAPRAQQDDGDWVELNGIVQPRQKLSHWSFTTSYATQYYSLPSWFIMDDPQPDPPKPLEPAEKRDAVITAWRAWRVDDLGRVAILRSIANETRWPAGEALSAPRVPTREYHAGIHAYKTIDKTKQTYRKDMQAYGTVALWGKVVEHEHGYRAEFAYPQHLYVKSAEMARKIRDTYGCEVTVDKRGN